MVVFNEYNDGIVKALETIFIFVMRMKKQEKDLGVVFLLI